MHLLLSPTFVTKTIKDSDVRDIIKVSNAISYDNQSKDIKQFIEKSTFENINKKVTTNNDFLKSINSQVILDFTTKKNLEVIE